MDIRGEYEFSVFIKKAVFCSGSDSYVELYNMLLRSHTSLIARPIQSSHERVTKAKLCFCRSFVAADADLDGKVTDSEFSQMIAAASEFPRYECPLDLQPSAQTSSFMSVC